MLYTIITNKREACASCLDVCPTAGIRPSTVRNNAKVVDSRNYIDFYSCIGCGACIQLRPVQ